MFFIFFCFEDQNQKKVTHFMQHFMIPIINWKKKGKKIYSHMQNHWGHMWSLIKGHQLNMILKIFKKNDCRILTQILSVVMVSPWYIITNYWNNFYDENVWPIADASTDPFLSIKLTF